MKLKPLNLAGDVSLLKVECIVFRRLFIVSDGSMKIPPVLAIGIV